MHNAHSFSDMSSHSQESLARTAKGLPKSRTVHSAQDHVRIAVKPLPSITAVQQLRADNSLTAVVLITLVCGALLTIGVLQDKSAQANIANTKEEIQTNICFSMRNQIQVLKVVSNLLDDLQVTSVTNNTQFQLVGKNLLDGYDKVFQLRMADITTGVDQLRYKKTASGVTQYVGSTKSNNGRAFFEYGKQIVNDKEIHVTGMNYDGGDDTPKDWFSASGNKHHYYMTVRFVMRYARLNLVLGGNILMNDFARDDEYILCDTGFCRHGNRAKLEELPGEPAPFDCGLMGTMALDIKYLES